MDLTPTTKKVIAKECRFVQHIPSKRHGEPDLHMVKERVHYDDNTSEPVITFIEDFKRPVWITNKRHQKTHTQKKEWELLENLDRYDCTQSELRDLIAKAIDKQWSNDHLKKLLNNPYVYGADITASALIKSKYLAKWPDHRTGYTLAAWDTETNVLDGSNHVTMATITMGSKVFTAVHKTFLEGIADPEIYLDMSMKKRLGDVIEARKLECEFTVVEREIDVFIEMFRRAHEWKPDFLSAWNMDFDIRKLLEACERAGIDPKHIVSDPSVPKNRRHFKYRPGPTKKKTASGREMPIKNSAQWHTVEATSSFYFVDSMCAFRQIRTGQQEEASYSLDSLAKKYLKKTKLKHEGAVHYTGKKWHAVMQSQFKIDYVTYNRYDCIVMLEFDEALLDLSFTMPTYASWSDFNRFNSQPKRVADDLFFHCLEHGRVVGTVGTGEDIVVDTGEEDPDIVMTDDEDDPECDQFETVINQDYKEQVLSLKDWIVTLPAHNTANNGLRCIAEDPTIITNARGGVFDIDAVSSYPSDTMACNVSKETTVREIITVLGVEETVFRHQNINLLSGHVNAIEYCVNMFDMPTPQEMLAMYLNDNPR